MPSSANSISIEDFLSAVSSSKNTQKLQFALQSFAKRNSYAQIYFDDFIIASQALPLERIDFSGNIRSKFEAYATSYIANAHAMIDSFPYVIFLSLEQLSYVDGKGNNQLIKASNSNWNENFYSGLLQDYPKYKRLSDLYWSILKDENFVLLRKISNNHKHKFLTRIVNTKTTLRYEVIDYELKITTHVDVKKFFIRLHNKLLPKIFKMYQELEKSARKHRKP